MKFKELPEGYYYVWRTLKDVVYIGETNRNENQAIYAMDPYAINVVNDGRTYRHFGREIGELEAVFRPRDEVRKEERKERKSYGAKLGHVTKRLIEKKPLTGKTLKTALELITCDDPEVGINKDPFFIGIAEKMKTGQPLTDYEFHIVVDVRMVHERF